MSEIRRQTDSLVVKDNEQNFYTIYEIRIYEENQQAGGDKELVEKTRFYETTTGEKVQKIDDNNFEIIASDGSKNKVFKS